MGNGSDRQAQEATGQSSAALPPVRGAMVGMGTGAVSVSSPGGIPMDPATREKLIVQHVSLVHHIVGRIGAHLPDNVEREDLVSAGILGLIKAVDRYDPTRGAKLATYASSVIRGEVMECLRSKDWAPRSVRRRARDAARTAARLEYELGRPPAEHEIAAALGLDIDEYRDLLDETSAATLLSLEEALAGDDDPNDETEDVEPWDTYGDPSIRVEQEAIRKVISQAVTRLPERERQVIALYYQEGMTLKEIGLILEVTESRICQIHGQAIQRLRGMAERELSLSPLS